jgi:hypothetical protein
VWVGLVDAEPLPDEPDGLYGEVAGAFTTFACIADSAASFRAASTSFLRAEGWRLISVEDVEPADVRLSRARPHREVLDIIDAVRRDGKPRTPDGWDLYENEE